MGFALEGSSPSFGTGKTKNFTIGGKKVKVKKELSVNWGTIANVLLIVVIATCIFHFYLSFYVNWDVKPSEQYYDFYFVLFDCEFSLILVSLLAISRDNKKKSKNEKI